MLLKYFFTKKIAIGFGNRIPSIVVLLPKLFYMGRVRQKIKVGKYEVVIVNMEAQGKVIVTVIDKRGSPSAS